MSSRWFETDTGMTYETGVECHFSQISKCSNASLSLLWGKQFRVCPAHLACLAVSQVLCLHPNTAEVAQASWGKRLPLSYERNFVFKLNFLHRSPLSCKVKDSKGGPPVSCVFLMKGRSGSADSRSTLQSKQIDRDLVKRALREMGQWGQRWLWDSWLLQSYPPILHGTL